VPSSSEAVKIFNGPVFLSSVPEKGLGTGLSKVIYASAGLPNSWVNST